MKGVLAKIGSRLLGLLFIVAIACTIGFIRLYEFSFGIIDLVAAIILYTTFQLIHYKKRNDKSNKKIIRKHVLFVWLYLAILIFVPTMLNWISKTLPVQDPDLTFMTLQMPIDNLFPIFLKDFIINVVLYPIIFSTIILWPFYFFFRKLRFRKTVFVSTFLVFLVAASFPPWNAIPSQSMQHLKNHFFGEPTKSHFSKFYKDHFVTYKPEMVTADDTTRNMIFIYVEALENSFIKYIPEIRLLYNQSLSFNDQRGYSGGASLIGTNSNISSIVAKTTGMLLLCGDPFMEKYSELNETFFDSVPSLYDVLHHYNYRNFYIQGNSTEKDLTSLFMSTHGIDHIYGKDDIEAKLIAKGETYPDDDSRLSDTDVLNYAKSILDTLSNGPFSMTIKTYDTHSPNGFFDERCGEKPQNSSEKDYYAAVLKCTSKRIGEFVKWVQTKPFGSNTEIVISGSHLFNGKSPVSDMPIATRRFLTMHFNPKYTTPNVTRRHSSLDFAPTVLETMGFHLEGHRLGFGTSLLSPESTIVEKQIPRMAIRSFRGLSGSIEYNNLFQNKAP